MYTKAQYVFRIKIIALSQIDQIIDNVKTARDAYKKNTVEYCDAMHQIIKQMTLQRLTEVVETLRSGYEEMGVVDDRIIADSLMTLALAEYQNYIDEENVYDQHWNNLIEDYFKIVQAAQGDDNMLWEE
jgi:uncharacterized protein YeeX (DUF496 family)